MPNTKPRPKNGDGHTRERAAIRKTTSKKPEFSSAKSTSTAAQIARIAKMLRTGDRSTLDFRRKGIMAPAARVIEMNERHGFDIRRIALRDLYDGEGFRHCRVAIYRMFGSPDVKGGR
jgi:hypothetical protein